MTDPHTGPTPVQRHSPKVIGAIYGLFRNLEVHDEHNQLFEQLTLEILHALVAFESNVGETFTLQTYGQEAVVCSRLLRLDDTNFERTTMLGKLLVRAGIGGLMLGGSTSKENVEHFSRDLRQALKGDTTALQRGAYGEILFATLEEDPSALHATRPEQLALWLFATLLDLICTLAQARDEGQRPSLLPLKRVLQRISEAARKHGAVFQLGRPTVDDHLSIGELSEPITKGPCRAGLRDPTRTQSSRVVVDRRGRNPLSDRRSGGRTGERGALLPGPR